MLYPFYSCVTTQQVVQGYGSLNIRAGADLSTPVLRQAVPGEELEGVEQYVIVQSQVDTVCVLYVLCCVRDTFIIYTLCVRTLRCVRSVRVVQV